jgi:hypothetical protein
VRSLATQQVPHLPAAQFPLPRPQVAPQDRLDRGEEKPYRTRFIEKMAELLDCPERMNIIKYEINSLISRK